MLLIGGDVSPKLELVARIEARRCITSERNDALVRLEIGGAAPRLIAGARVKPFETMDGDPDATQLGLEAGALVDLHARFGVHAAVTFGAPGGYVSGQIQSLVSEPEAATRFALLGALGVWPLPRSQPMNVVGRPIVRAGEIVRPRVIAWRGVRDPEERAVRDHFAATAQLELSSVWTFLRLAAELAALGAPRHLIVAALDAADDELRHAELCAAAAGAIELAMLPGALARPRFAQRTPHALATLAREAWLEGCLNETAAAEEARLASAETHGPVSAMLATIAQDEQRHAELSWMVLAWLRSIAPETLAALPRPPRMRAPVLDPALARRGIPMADVTEAASAYADRVGHDRLAALA